MECTFDLDEWIFPKMIHEYPFQTAHDYYGWLYERRIALQSRLAHALDQKIINATQCDYLQNRITAIDEELTSLDHRKPKKSTTK